MTDCSSAPHIPCGSKGGYAIMAAPLDEMSLKQLTPTIHALARAGADEEFAEWVRRKGNAEKLVEFYRESMTIWQEPGLPPDHYRIFVDVASAKTMTDSTVRASYAHMWVNSSWHKSTYEMTLHSTIRDHWAESGQQIFFAKKFERRTSELHALQWAEFAGYRLLLPHEREAFARAMPELQLRCTLIDLGSSVHYGHHHLTYPTLGKHDGRRVLRYEREPDQGWEPSCRFLFIRN